MYFYIINQFEYSYLEYMKKNSSYLENFVVSSFVAMVAILIYHYYFNEPKIIFQDSAVVRNVSFTDNAGINGDRDFTAIAKKNLSAVVYINALKSDGSGMFTNNTGSGVFIAPNGYIATNTHVVAGASKIVVITESDKSYNAKIVGKDEATDIAVLKIDNSTSPFVSFGNSDVLNVGEWTMLIGSPFKLRNSVSVGVISAKNRTLNLLGDNSIESYIQTDAVANPGNSGGGMFDAEGKYVGMISAISTDSGNFQGYSFAIPSNIVKKVAFDIINYGVVQRAWLGVLIKNIEGEDGVEIERVNSNGAADKSGLKTGDKILGIDGIRIIDVAQFEGLISQYKPGDKIKIKYLRNGKTLFANSVLRNHLNTTDLIANRNDDVLVNLGFVLRDLTSEEKAVSSGYGVMVVSVIQGSKISNINIEPGYLITSINGMKIMDVNDFIAKLNNSTSEIQLKGVYKSYPGIFPYVFEK